VGDRTLPTGEEKARAVRGLFDTIADRYDLVNAVMTFGMDTGWRRRSVRELRLPGRSLVLDLACGTGDFCRELERAGYRAVGFDFSAGMLARAHSGGRLVQADILRLPIGDGRADGVTCGFALRNVTDLAVFFQEVARVLRPGGRAAFLETSEPDGRLMRAGHGAYFRRVVPLIGAALSNGSAYRYLPRSMAYLPSPDALLTLFRATGFVDARRIGLAAGATQLIVGTRA